MNWLEIGPAEQCSERGSFEDGFTLKFSIGKMFVFIDGSQLISRLVLQAYAALTARATDG